MWPPGSAVGGGDEGLIDLKSVTAVAGKLVKLD